MDDLIKRYDEDYKTYEVENAENFFSLMQLGLEDVGFSRLEASLSGEKRFIDVGCATGMLVAHLQSRGWKALGTEVCTASAEYGRTRRGVPILEGTLDQLDLDENYFDLVHSSHVIEHVPEPGDFLKEVFRITKPGGHFICVTPNTASFQARFYRREWRSAIADHVHLFSLLNLKALMSRRGFEILKEGTWGGIPRGEAPVPLKKIVDKAAKRFGFGDVMILLGRKPL
jgi:2-polyprenyl-3-methyl-5-hydroxy-6-metoxy-1,4-benzoquinol methylase